MFWYLGEFFCPYTCVSCGKYGGILCDCCKKYITLAHEERCLKCGMPLWKGVCRTCALPFKKQFCLGIRRDILKKLISDYKYNSVRSCGAILAQMVAECIKMPHDAKIVPLPTISKHIRERGFDHTKCLAKQLARLTGCSVAQILQRNNNCTQVGASQVERQEQAKTAYTLKKDVDRSKNYYLLDDVWTTGSSMMNAARVLQENKISEVNAIIIAKSGRN